MSARWSTAWGIVICSVEYGHDIGMTQLRERARLAKEPLPEIVVALEFGPDHLDGDEPIEERLSPLVDHPHAAVAEQLEHFKARQARVQLLGGEGGNVA